MFTFITIQMWGLFATGAVAGAALTTVWLQNDRIGQDEEQQKALRVAEADRKGRAAARARVAALEAQNDRLERLLDNELRFRVDMSWALSGLTRAADAASEGDDAPMPEAIRSRSVHAVRPRGLRDIPARAHRERSA